LGATVERNSLKNESRKFECGAGGDDMVYPIHSDTKKLD
jgi:hypothetical protein